MERLKAIIAVIFFVAALIFSEGIEIAGSTSIHKSRKSKRTNQRQNDSLVQTQHNFQSVPEIVSFRSK